MFYCYILESLKSGQYYIGSTKQLSNRLDEHNKGKVKSTLYNRPWKMLYYEEFESLKYARHRELQIKRWKSRAAIERLIKFK